jgi:hypothetical protein
MLRRDSILYDVISPHLRLYKHRAEGETIEGGSLEEDGLEGATVGGGNPKVAARPRPGRRGFD